MEKDQKTLQEEYDRLVKVCSAKTDIVSVSAHQIRTSLSALKWIIKMFLDGDLGKLTTEQESLMKKAYEGNDRAIEKVSELLSINKNDHLVEKELVFTETDILELIDSVIFDFFGEAHSRGIEIILLTPDSKPAPVKADKGKLRIVLQNLLENAIKYNNPKGKVFISLKQEGEFVEVSFRDTGVGISEESKKKIFEKFYRDPEIEKKEAVGSGIGLFDTKKIIEDHGGKIWFESQFGRGATFFFTLPIFK